MLKRLEAFFKKPSVSLVFHMFEKLGHVVAVVSVIVAAALYVTEADDRRRSNEFQAWQLVLLLEGKQAGGARADALEYLASNDVSLAGVPLVNAKLVGAHLEGAVLYEAKLNDADLSQAKLHLAELHGAELKNAILMARPTPGDRVTFRRTTKSSTYSSEFI